MRKCKLFALAILFSYDATVFGEIANTDYEGEISKMGDTVNIRTTPTITIRDYKKGQKLQTETPDSPKIQLLIDRAKYFQFTVDNIDRMQADIDQMTDWSNDASEQMKITIDTDVLGSIPADVAAANKGTTAGRKSSLYNLGTTGSAVAVTSSNILEYITALGAVGDEQNWPENSRWLILPAWMRWVLMQSDLKNASLSGDDTSILRNGRIGMIDRFSIYISNNLTSVSDGGNTCWNILAGHKSGLTFASQMTEMDSLKAESTFGTLVRGLNVYGFKTEKPESLALLYARKG